MSQTLQIELGGQPVNVIVGDDNALSSIAASNAQASAAVALAAAGPNYASTAAGLAATTLGDAFAVDEGDTIAVYRHDAGPVATFLRRYPQDIGATSGASLIGTANGSTVQEQVQDINSIRFYGYRGNGLSNPLSTVTRFKGQNTTGWTLSQWQAAVPQVTALTNEIDSIAVQAWFNDRPNGGRLNLPAGLSIWNTTVNTGLDQAVEIQGAGRDATEIEWRSTSTLWRHGFTGSTGANKHFYARDFRVTPNADAASACCFNVRFSGTQAAWCHVISDVIVIARDTTSWFTNVTITRNIKRGLDWRNFNVFGRNFFILGTDAHVFPSNVASDPDCPPGQAGEDAGDSYNFDNCMTVGYRWGWIYDWTGWTEILHSHEQGRWANAQSYSGVGVASLVNTNDGYAPGDNWIFDTPGWQGIGPAFDIRWQEHVRIYDGLLVADDTSVNNITRCGQFIDCNDTIIEANEIFTEGTWEGGNMWAVGGSRTRTVFIDKNFTVHNATAMDDWLFVASTVPARQVIERDNAFTGPGAYGVAKINDASGGAISETRVKDIVEALPGSGWSWSVAADGSITYRNVHTGDTDANGRITVTMPTGLFRSFRNATATNGFDIIDSPIAIGNATTTSVVFRYTALSSVTPVGFYYEVVGR
jgi:hypothetical protein